ncbi:uncharacterized protein BXZ73DRAFT_79060 [Epithele typhae]|uniref:uncharacterized protein n=1 Tax=Epithele typhae TaxID=378194 RepID=UPI0020072A78|nr:uncharacterized protein BXZ73DRAFT_79060 [Epithele typhae]KAH9925401.1 hypothetical protein BXZ73DRAFT_79060 [Epithele typhae]
MTPKQLRRRTHVMQDNTYLHGNVGKLLQFPDRRWVPVFGVCLRILVEGKIRDVHARTHEGEAASNGDELWAVEVDVAIEILVGGMNGPQVPDDFLRQTVGLDAEVGNGFQRKDVARNVRLCGYRRHEANSRRSRSESGGGGHLGEGDCQAVKTPMFDFGSSPRSGPPYHNPGPLFSEQNKTNDAPSHMDLRPPESPSSLPHRLLSGPTAASLSVTVRRIYVFDLDHYIIYLILLPSSSDRPQPSTTVLIMDKGKRKAVDDLDTGERRLRLFNTSELSGESSSDADQTASRLGVTNVPVSETGVQPREFDDVVADAPEPPAIGEEHEATKLSNFTRDLLDNFEAMLKQWESRMGPVRTTRSGTRDPTRDFADEVHAHIRKFKNIPASATSGRDAKDELRALIRQTFPEFVNFMKSHCDWNVKRIENITEGDNVTESQVDALVNPYLTTSYDMRWFGVEPQARFFKEMNLAPVNFTRGSEKAKGVEDWRDGFADVVLQPFTKPTITSQMSPSVPIYSTPARASGSGFAAFFAPQMPSHSTEKADTRGTNGTQPDYTPAMASTSTTTDTKINTDLYSTPESSPHASGSTNADRSGAFSFSSGVPTPNITLGDVSLAGVGSDPGHSLDERGRPITNNTKRRVSGLPDFAVVTHLPDGFMLHLVLIVEDKVVRNPAEQMKRYPKLIGRRFGPVNVVGIRITPNGKGLQMKWARLEWGRNLSEDDDDEPQVVYAEGDDASSPNKGWYPAMCDFSLSNLYKSRKEFLEKLLKLIEDHERMPL